LLSIVSISFVALTRLIVTGILYSVYHCPNTMATVNPIIPAPVVKSWWVCLEGIIGFSAATGNYLFGDRVGIDTVDSFVHIPASSFDDLIKVTGEPRRFPPVPPPAARVPAGRLQPGIIAIVDLL
jgi:hypothetical protein